MTLFGRKSIRTSNISLESTFGHVSAVHEEENKRSTIYLFGGCSEGSDNPNPNSIASASREPFFTNTLHEWVIEHNHPLHSKNMADVEDEIRGMRGMKKIVPKSTFVPSPRIGSSMVYYNESLYIFGGLTFDGSISNDVFRFNLKNLEWSGPLVCSGVSESEQGNQKTERKVIMFFRVYPFFLRFTYH